MKATNCYSAKFEEMYEQNPKRSTQIRLKSKKFDSLRGCGSTKDDNHNIEDGG